MNRFFLGARRTRAGAAIAALVLGGGCGHDDANGADVDGELVVQNLAVDCRSGGGAPVTETHSGGSGFALRAPASWLELAERSPNEMQLVVSYTDGSFANVLVVGPTYARDEADALRRLEDVVGYGNAGKHHFTFRGYPATASFSRYTESAGNCEVCANPPAEMLSLNVAIANGTQVVRLVGEAPAKTSTPVLCELQATMASATW